ncbi:leucine-rich repeat-containing protein 15-like [Anopheles nili]|uniref:leucine-rich repeat-containing protein 15-like n=1 Tax=Anopheles nili TaxID=185578 RepID=UPI00237A824A|nr:leucine-rich repeat-containing protein 15-like [Anopheles nili]
MKLSFVGVVVGICLNAFVSIETAEAALCLCHPSSCLIINANSSVLSHLELHCPTPMININDLLILRYFEPSLHTDAFLSFPNLTSLEIFQGSLARIDPGTFEKVPDLTKIIIRNNMLSSLEDYTFRGLGSLQFLYLISNELATIAPNALDGLKNLTHVVLSSNKLASVPAELFRSSPGLLSIHLNNNMLKELPVGLFDNIAELIRLDLSNNQLVTFDFPQLKVTLLFLHNNSLTSLHLDDMTKVVQADQNRISTITGSGSGITDLLLNDNALTNITPLTHMTNLTKLNLSKNPLAPNSVFSGLSRLRELLLSHTNIQLSDATFANLTQLVMLDLSYNNLTELDFHMFSSQMELQSLIVAYNNISKINFIELREYLPELRVLEICGNGWNSTYLQQMLSHMRRYKLKADMQGLAHTVLFSSAYIELCGTEPAGKSTADDGDYYTDDISDILNEDIDEFYHSSTLKVDSRGQESTTARSDVTHVTVMNAAAEPSMRLNAVPNTASVQAVVPDADSTDPSSPLFIAFQVLAYMFAVFGVGCLVVLVYYLRQRRFDVHRLTPVDNADSVRLV